MNRTSFAMERSVARCRVLLSLVAILALYIDPTEPTLTRWLPLTGGAFTINRYWATVLTAHLLYSLALFYLQVVVDRTSSRLTVASTIGDILFAAAIALVTEGTTSPFYSFFTFAVVASGLRSGLRATLVVTGLSVALYMLLIVGSANGAEAYYLMMRAAYIAIAGYLVGYLGQERIKQEDLIRSLESSAQREHFARSLHDGYVQSLAGVNLRLGTCQELLRRGRQDDAARELAELQSGINREHDELRSYIRSLIDAEPTTAQDDLRVEPSIAVRAFIQGAPALIEHTLLIAVEGIRNVRRHARATTALVRADMDAEEVLMTIEDDGIGFPPEGAVPWSIASRVNECRGRIHVENRTKGAALKIRLPEK